MMDQHNPYLEILSQLQTGVVVYRPDTSISYGNPCACELLGLSNNTNGDNTAILSTRVFVDAHGCALPKAQEPVWRVLNSNQPIKGLVLGIMKAPHLATVWLKVDAFAQRNAANELTHIVVNFDDITTQRKNELEAQRNMHLLLGSIEAIDEAYVIYDAQERLVYCNDKYIRLYPHLKHLIVPGTQFEDIIRGGAEVGFYQDSVNDVENWVQQRLQSFRAGNQTRIQRTTDGRILRAVERKMADGHTVGFRIDITELVTATDAALAASRAKSRFLATMSHEIRTPMNGILGMAQLLLTPNLPDTKRQDYAQIILSSGHTLLSLLNDILDLSKIEAGKLELEKTPMSPDALMHEVVALFKGAAQEKGLQLSHCWHGQVTQRFVADAHRLRQMLSNLVGNALKFTPHGQVQIVAQVVQSADVGPMLEFTVSDTGMGIAADKLDLLFQPFSQTDSSTTRKYGGSGLGLSIVSHLAQAMGGTVGVRSDLGRGASFWFRLPAVVAPNAPSQVTAACPVRAIDNDSRLSGHVWVAEDNLVNCMVIESLLNQLGLEVTLFDDGQQLVTAMMQFTSQPLTTQGTPPNLILMDLNMPVMDGYVATEKIRQWEDANQQPRLPIIALTADAFEEDHQHCLHVGMDDFLTKPIALGALTQALMRWLPVASTHLAR